MLQLRWRGEVNSELMVGYSGGARTDVDQRPISPQPMQPASQQPQQPQHRPQTLCTLCILCSWPCNPQLTLSPAIPLPANHHMPLAASPSCLRAP